MAASLVSALVEEVADLLRHDNMDTRIITFLRMAYNDMLTRMPVWRFYGVSNVMTISAGETDALAGGGRIDFTDPVVCLAFDNSGILRLPRYLPLTEFRRTAHYNDGDAAATGSIPLIWTIGPANRTTNSATAGRANLYIWPSPSAGSFTFYLIGRKQRETTDKALSSRYPLPYHMETALVWGAAYFGAKALRPELASLFMTEYEQAIRNLTWILTYKPDATPVLREVGSPYARSSRMATMPRIPNNIPSS